MRVDLPAPLGPRNAVTLPGSARRSSTAEDAGASTLGAAVALSSGVTAGAAWLKVLNGPLYCAPPWSMLVE